VVFKRIEHWRRERGHGLRHEHEQRMRSDHGTQNVLGMLNEHVLRHVIWRHVYFFHLLRIGMLLRNGMRIWIYLPFIYI
jgi:hypothetical protein